VKSADAPAGSHRFSLRREAARGGGRDPLQSGEPDLRLGLDGQREDRHGLPPRRHKALYERSYPIDFLHPKDFDGGDILEQYRVIIVPFPYFLNEDICARLADWVKAGGTLIGEAFFGGWHKEEGRHHTTIPGYGLDRVFGVRQKNAEPASEHAFLSVSGVVREGSSMDVQRGVNQHSLDGGFIAGQPVDASNGLGSVDIRMTRALPPLREGDLVRGLLTKETYFVEGAEVLAEYADGQPAVVMNEHGKGRAILIGSYVALPYQRLGFRNDGALFAALVGMDESNFTIRASPATSACASTSSRQVNRRCSSCRTWRGVRSKPSSRCPTSRPVRWTSSSAAMPSK
jgi:hypothetical protein